MENKKRLRINGTYRWTEQQTKDLLRFVVDNVKASPEQFEKPTAQKFYGRITENAPNLPNIKWDIMCTKMRHVRASFLSALKWKGQTGAGLLGSGDGKSVEEYVKKICPFYDDLHSIFGQRVNIQPPAIYQSTESVCSLENNEAEVLLEIDCETFSPSLLESPLVSPSVILPPTFSGNLVSPSGSVSTSDTYTKKNTTTPKRNVKRPNSSNPFALLFEIQNKKVELETQKLELEKEKRRTNLNCRNYSWRNKRESR